ncbi:MAG TPA: AAA family ATPase [Candidatus Saccharimonadia bacterium]|nr:AAA family ATPase [Candidatus Saccharimonadia bacterium]
MSAYSFNAGSLLLQEARLRRSGGQRLAQILLIAIVVLAVAAAGLGLARHHQAVSLAGLALGLLTLRLWLVRRVLALQAAPLGSTTQLEQLLPPELAAAYRPNLTAPQLWTILTSTWQAQFVMARFGLYPEVIAEHLGDEPLDHDQLWQAATAQAQATSLPRLNSAVIVTALFAVRPGLVALLPQLKLTSEDLTEGAAWLGRLEAFQAAKRPVYGGIARDWAAGFTPTLSRFGQNISQQVELGGKQFGLQERTQQLDALVTGLNSASGSVAVIGEPGIGKSSLLLGLADRLLQGQDSGRLAHHQIFSLNASLILGQQQGAGDIERIVLMLFGEALHAGNIVVALDEAQLFFGQGTGAVNLSQLLLPILQAHSIKLVLNLTPGDWQKLKSTNAAMTSLLTPLVLVEPSQTDTLRVLADRALIMEGDRLTTYQALQEAYRLAGRYFQDEAYPGRALKLLEAALNHPDGQLISATSVQEAVESQLGVKVQSATVDESDALLHLEDHIHERMINQSRAVSVVAAALRRARAGVANPRRPIGSFLFLGPTGVGKTELARSLAAVYFGAERNIIRLDMSEYQQTSDVARLLESAAENPEGLLAKVRTAPFSVVLFDEIEKANPNILNLFLQLLDEGNLTDSANKPASFKDAIVIATSNAGADEIRRHIEAGEELESFEQAFTDNLINSGQFKPELINRFDEVVLFRPLNPAELVQVVQLLINEVNRTLEPQKIQVKLTDAAAAELVRAGYDPRLGARPMRRMVQRRVEDTVAGQILRGQARPGDTISLDIADVGGPAQAPVAASTSAAAPAATPPPPPAPPPAPAGPQPILPRDDSGR